MLKTILLTTSILSTNFAYAAQEEVTASATATQNTAAFTPEKILADGADISVSVNPYTGESGEVRKGTIAATLNNVAFLNNLIITKKSDQEIQSILHEIAKLVPSLRVVGMFDLFSVEEWLADQPGRQLAAILYLQAYPDKLNSKLVKIIKDIEKNTKHDALKSEIRKINIPTVK